MSFSIVPPIKGKPYSARNLQLLLLFAIIFLQPLRLAYGLYNGLLGLAMLYIIVMVIRKRFIIIPKMLVILFLLYTASIIISTILSIDREESLDQIRSEYLKHLIVFCLIVVHGADVKERIHAILAAFLFSGIVMSTIGLFPYLLDMGLADEKSGRLVSLAESYTRLGYFYVLFVPLLVLLMSKAGWKVNIPLSVILILSLLSTYLSMTRAAWICVPLAGAAALSVIRKWKPLLVFAVIFVIITGIMLLTVPSARERVADFKEIATGSGSFGERLDTWNSACRTIADHPVFGVGYGKYIFEKAYELNPVEGSRPYCDVHNNYLEILLERGVVGFITTFALYAWFLIRAFRLYRHGNAWGKYYFAYFAAVSIAFALFSMTGVVYLKETGRYFWQIGALALVLPDIAFSEKKNLNFSENNDEEK